MSQWLRGRLAAAQTQARPCAATRGEVELRTQRQRWGPVRRLGPTTKAATRSSEFATRRRHDSGRWDLAGLSMGFLKNEVEESPWRAVPAAPQHALSGASAAGAARPPTPALAVAFWGFIPLALRAPKDAELFRKRI